MPSKPLHVCVIAGEPSGDVLGAALMRALAKGAKVDIEFSGVGGVLMQAQGLASLFPMENLSVMGLAEVLPRLPQLMARIDQTATHVMRSKPDVLITIDSPDFCFRVARKVPAQSEGGPLKIHYVAPTVWAWRPERAKKLAALYDGIVCLLPFEPDYFTAEGMKAVFAGHPLIEQRPEGIKGRDALRRELGVAPETKLLGLLFGSRIGELNRVGPVLREAAIKTVRDNPGTEIIAPTLPHLEREVKNFLHKMPCKTHCIAIAGKKWPAFAAMDAAIAVSGTVGLELAVAGVPHTIAYKMSSLTWRLVKGRIQIKYAHLASILLDEPVVPEFIQDRCKADSIAEAASALLAGDIVAARQKKAFEKVRGMIGEGQKEKPSAVAAGFILEMLSSAQSRSGSGTYGRESGPV